MEKREVLRRFRKTVSVGAGVTLGGRQFQRRLPATGNPRSPINSEQPCASDHCYAATYWVCRVIAGLCNKGGL